MKRRVRTSVKHLKRIGALRNERRTITRFADEFGLVYFGAVSQYDDEHRIVRGMTLSPRHRDAHYCIGTYENYDVVYVKRTDTLRTQGDKKKTHTWHIMAFDLHASGELPHIFVGLPSHSEEFYMQFFTKFPTMRYLSLGHLGEYPSEFVAGCRLYANPRLLLEVERIITPKVAGIIATHFKGLAFEVVDNTLLVYSEHARLSKELLETILKNSRWLAESLDRSATEFVPVED